MTSELYAIHTLMILLWSVRFLCLIWCIEKVDFGERYGFELNCFIQYEKSFRIDLLILLKPTSHFPRNLTRDSKLGTKVDIYMFIKPTPLVKLLVHFPLENFIPYNFYFRALCQKNKMKKCLKENLHKSSCFLVSKNKTYNFEEAEKYCKSEGMQLASIHSEAEHNFVQGNVFKDMRKLLI